MLSLLSLLFLSDDSSFCFVFSFTNAKKDIMTNKSAHKMSKKKQEQKARQLSSNIRGKERAEILKVVNDDDESIKGEEGEGSFYDDSLFDMVEQLDDMDRC